MPLLIKSSPPNKEGILQVSKSRKLPLLIEEEEMRDLLDALGSFHLFDVSRPLLLEEAEIQKSVFLGHYASYIAGIKQGHLVDEIPLRPFFSCAMSFSSDFFYAQQLPNGKYLVKSLLPVVQLQRHHFIYSDQFHFGVMGKGSITWGIQFSYPQFYLDPHTKEIGKVEKNERFPNTALFHTLSKWVRENTRPTPFLLEGKRTNQPIRLGKKCFSWINQHPKLKERGLHVEDRGNSSQIH